MNSSSFETISLNIESSIATITLSRPKKLNAVNGLMIDELHQCLDVVANEDAVRAVILNGEGRAFSAGFDLDSDAQAVDSDPDYWNKELRKDFDIIMRFWDFPKPTIAAVHGYCLGSSLEISLACDITISSDDCLFGAPEVKHGDGIICLILPWIIGVKAAKELLLSGDDKVTAQRALGLGMINKIVPAEQVQQAAKDLAKRIATNDRLAVTLTKKAINESFEVMGMRKALEQALEIDMQITNEETQEAKTFSKITREQGLKAALAWRTSLLV